MKKSKEPRPIITTPMIWIVREKYGDRYFYVTTDDDLFKAALKLLTERFKSRNYYFKPSEKDRPSPPEIDKEQMATMPKALRAHAEALVRAYDTRMLIYQSEVDVYQAVYQAVLKQDGRAAWNVLQSRRAYEYEGYSLELLEKF